MTESHEIILMVGALCLAAIGGGVLSARIGAPFLLVFIGIGMLAGEDGLIGITFNDVRAAYLIGSIALAVILFQGGLATTWTMLRSVLAPSAALATVGVTVSAGLVGAVASHLLGLPWVAGLLIGVALAPTDAAAVSVLLRISKAAVPSRVVSILEVESGLNDPMSVFLTLALLTLARGEASSGHALRLFVGEMGGGLLFGLAGGYGLLWLFRFLRMDRAVYPVLALGGALSIFGAAQIMHTSGFLAVYIAGVIVASHDHPVGEPVGRLFSALRWMAQITLFLMLGLLATPHEMLPYALPALAISAFLILAGRPLSVALCLLPFRWPTREIAFVSWVGLRGAVPIYLTTVSLLDHLPVGHILFNVVFIAVIVSVLVQGWTIRPMAKLLGFTGERIFHNHSD